MGGWIGLLAGFVGLVGLAAMIANLRTTAADPVGIILFSLLLLNGLYAVYRRVSGKEDTGKARGPFSSRGKR